MTDRLQPMLEIFSQGEEIVTGQTVDTNAAWLSEQAVQLGFQVTRHTAVGDKLADLIALLREISERADCCLCTGGLGPTGDDLTAEAVAKAFGLPLEFDETAFEQIRRYFENRKRPMPEINRKQALLPEGALRLDNDWGTAPGFSVRTGRCRFAFLPGVPSEMRRMFEERVKPMLAGEFNLAPSRLVTLKTVGIGESDIQQLIGDIEIPVPVQLGFRAGADEVQTKLLFPHGYPEADVAGLTGRIAERLSPAVLFGIDGLNGPVGSLASVVDKLMRHAGLTLAVAETASHGLLAAKCLGCSWLSSAIYEQSPASLARRIGIAIDTNADPAGAAPALAGALWSQNNVDMVLVQLHQGSADQFQDKDQTVALTTALVHNKEMESTHTSLQLTTLSGPAARKQNQAALHALNQLRRYLEDLT